MTTQQQPVQLTNEEKAKVFAMYMGAEVSNIYNNKNGTVSGAYLPCTVGVKYNTLWYLDVSECQLLLTPLSAITDEDAVEVWHLDNSGEPDDTYTVEFVKHWIENDLLSWDHYEYLKSKFYAVPIFFAPYHPANGKTAIELGIAREKTN